MLFRNIATLLGTVAATKECSELLQSYCANPNLVNWDDDAADFACNKYWQDKLQAVTTDPDSKNAICGRYADKNGEITSTLEDDAVVPETAAVEQEVNTEDSNTASNITGNTGEVNGNTASNITGDNGEVNGNNGDNTGDNGEVKGYTGEVNGNNGDNNGKVKVQESKKSLLTVGNFGKAVVAGTLLASTIYGGNQLRKRLAAPKVVEEAPKPPVKKSESYGGVIFMSLFVAAAAAFAYYWFRLR